MSWGRSNRLSRIFDPASGRTNMLAVDHGYFLGPITGMAAPRTAVAPLLPYADALMATRGLLRSSVDPALPRSIVLRVSGGTSIVGPSLSDETVITTVEDATKIDHPYYLTQNTIEAYLRRAGFGIVTVDYAADHLHVSYLCRLAAPAPDALPEPVAVRDLFREIRPVNTTVIVHSLVDPRWLLEIEVDAVVAGDHG